MSPLKRHRNLQSCVDETVFIVVGNQDPRASAEAGHGHHTPLDVGSRRERPGGFVQGQYCRPYGAVHLVTASMLHHAIF